MQRRMRAFFAASAVAIVLAACGTGGTGGGGPEEAEDYPGKELDWTIAFGPGGGNDIMARTMADILKRKKLYPADIRLENREGGSGATGWGYLFSKRGDPYAVSTTSGSFITTPLQADTGWTHKDFTPVGLFATDGAVFATSDDSGITSWEQWVGHAKRAGKVTVGGISTVNVDFIVHAMLADQAGYEIDYVPYNEEGQLITSLLSGALDAIVSNPGEITGQMEAGDLHGLVWTGSEPLTAGREIPTAESFGYEGIPTMPRGLILAPDAPDYAQQWWIETMKKVVATPEWKKYLESNQLTEDVRWGEDFAAYLAETEGQFERILREHGALK